MNILRSGAASAVALLMLTVAPGPLMSGAAAQETTKVASGHSLAIQVNQGQLVRIDRPVTSVFVADTEIADVGIKSQQLIYVFAKHPGTTTLYAVGANDEILASITLIVTHNLSRLDQAIADLMPGRNIAATSIERRHRADGHRLLAGRGRGCAAPRRALHRRERRDHQPPAGQRPEPGERPRAHRRNQQDRAASISASTGNGHPGGRLRLRSVDGLPGDRREHAGRIHRAPATTPDRVCGTTST